MSCCVGGYLPKSRQKVIMTNVKLCLEWHRNMVQICKKMKMKYLNNSLYKKEKKPLQLLHGIPKAKVKCAGNNVNCEN